MKLIIAFIFVVIISTGLLVNPVFVMAGDTCYVDEDVEDDGDGSEDEPYKDIEKALEEDCDDIKVAKGTYEESITIGKNVSVVGDDKDDVIITGKVIMKDGSSVKEITISGLGIDVDDDASVKIEDSKIKDARIGVETVGGGKLTVKNSTLYGNRKAMYLQRGKNIEIKNNNVYDNDEKGIDIRANVEGVISDNSIYNNGESGIEVILGKSDLKIYDNKIKKNKASGIAAQYYEIADNFGGVKIKNNTITSNSDFGINCKVPSGGNPGVDYWTKSIEMLANKVYSNKDGEFSDSCHFEEEKLLAATKTQKEIDQYSKATDEAQQKAAAEKDMANQKKQTEIDEIEKEEERKRVEQEQLRQQLQGDKNIQREIEEMVLEVSEMNSVDMLAKEKVLSRPSFLIFFIGPDYRELRSMALNIQNYDAKLEIANKKVESIADVAIREISSNDVLSIEKDRNDVYNFVDRYNNAFSLFGWLFKDKEN